MKEFLQVLRRFVPPYKKYLALSVLFNILSAVLNIFSFAALIPILQILFQTEKVAVATRLMSWNEASLKEVVSNNTDYYVQQLIDVHGTSTTLLVIGLLLAVMTFLKTGAYFLSSASIIPIRTGIVRDIRNQLYRKITSLSMGFFSEERKGDIIARMSGDVQEVENSIMSSLDMLFKNPILIIIYFLMAAHHFHPSFCTFVRLDHGSCGQKAKGWLANCTGIVERYHESSGRNSWRFAHY
mgnify:CR=1 FL=1